MGIGVPGARRFVALASPEHERRVADRMAAADQASVAIGKCGQQHHRAVEQRRLGGHLALPVLGDRSARCRARTDAGRGRADTSTASTGRMTLRGRSKLTRCRQAMSSVTATGQWSDAFGRSQPARGIALDLLAGRKDRAPGLAAADDVGNGLGVRRAPAPATTGCSRAGTDAAPAARACGRASSGRVPAAARRCFRKSRRRVSTLRQDCALVDRPRSGSRRYVSPLDLHPLPVIVHVAADHPALVGGMLLAETLLDDPAHGLRLGVCGSALSPRVRRARCAGCPST